MTRDEILRSADEENVRFLRLQFTDILGIIKNVEIPRSQFEKALDNDIMFDGSSIEGFSRIEESDMLLYPDPETFQINPWSNPDGSKVARLICDVYKPDGSAFPGCPRLALRRQVERAEKMGYTMVAGPEAEFFLFNKDESGRALPHETHDAGGYFDLAPVDLGEQCRRDIVMVLEAIGFEVEAAHHEVAPGQHEIDFKYAEAVKTADNVTTFRFVVKKVAMEHGLHATFMPKPIYGENGSGMHTHQSLFKDGENAFYDPEGPWELSPIALSYIGGLLEHAPGFVAITNPLVNSFKRLVPGYEAPINIAWSERNRSPLVRVPAKRGVSTRCELRLPDPACNPYLALAVTLAAGLDGLERNLEAGEPVNENIFTMSERKKRRLGIRQLPPDLNAALDQLERNKVVREALGDHIWSHFLEAKRQEWADFISFVHPWEQDRYLAAY
jgi:glutamine synthetase